VRLLLAIAGVLIAATAWSLTMHPAPPLGLQDSSWNEVFFFLESLLLVFYFAYFIKTPRHVVWTVVVLLLMIFVSGVEAITTGQRRAATEYLGGFTGNENRLAHFCLWGTALLWALRYKGPDGWWRPWTMVPLLGLPLITLMTGSRSGLIQLALLGGLMLLEQRRWPRGRRVQACAFMVIVGLVIAAVAPTAMVARATNLDVNEGTTISRVHAVEAGVMMVAENPLFGVGPGNFRWRYQLQTGALMTTHNSYIWAILTGGPLLLVLYLVLFYRCYRSLRAFERSGVAGFGWLATALRFNLILFLVFSCFATMWSTQIFWLLMSLTIVLTRLARAEARSLVGAPAPLRLR
jgi:O-antigen ligase